ncbi:MAG: ABC transporter substrate-binding protein, partial [Pseudomonadota bacterium]
MASVLLLGLPGPRSLQAASLTPPTVVSTNLCADLLALSLTSPEQLLSVSWKSQDPTRSSMAAEAAK